MGLFQRLFGKKNTAPVAVNEKPPAKVEAALPKAMDSSWQEVPFYLESEPEERELVAVIATAIAAGDAPESEFQVKRVLKKNPEAQLVATIVTAIAAGDAPASQFQVKKIYRKK